MENFWEKIKTGITQGAAVSAEKVELYSKIGKYKVEQFKIKKNIEKKYSDLGMRLYDLVKAGKGNTAGNDISVESFINDIDAFQTEVDDITIEIDKLKEEKAASEASMEVSESDVVAEESADVAEGDDAPITVNVSKEDTEEEAAEDEVLSR